MAYIGKGLCRGLLRFCTSGTKDLINLWKTANVVSEGDFIENGTKIRVTQIEGSRIVVKKV